MKIVNPEVMLLWHTPEPLIHMERAGRTAYKSEDKITQDSAEKFVKMIIEKGHLTVIEHASASIKVTCDRGVSHEIVRHRLFSFTQESTRYCNYNSGKFDCKISTIKPPQLDHDAYAEWIASMNDAEKHYMKLIELKCSPQIARSVLPNSLKTEIVITGNFREWKHFLKLRTDKAAHPQMQEIANKIKDILISVCPVVFS